MGTGDVLHFGEGFSAEGVSHEVAEGVCTAFAGFVGGFGGVERAVEYGGGAAFVPFQVGVSAGHGEAVELAHRRADDDFDRVAQIPHHLFDDGHLLGVFLAEVRFLRLDGVEQFGDDGRHPTEVAGAHGPFEELGQLFDLHPGLEAGGIHLFLRGRPDDIGALVAEFRQVAFHIAGVGGQVFVGAKLGGVDENRGGNGFTGHAGGVDEGEVSLMEGAHRRDEAERFGEWGEGSAEGEQGGEGLHGLILLCSFPSARKENRGMSPIGR